MRQVQNNANRFAHLAPPGVPAARKTGNTPPPELPEEEELEAPSPDRPGGHKGLQVLMGAGMLAGGLIGGGTTVLAAQAPQAQAQATPQEHLQMLSQFQSQGSLYKRVLGFRRNVTPEVALQRLNGNSPVYVLLKNGPQEKLKSVQDLETLDTLDGQGLHPNLPADLIESIHQLERGQGPKDGLFRSGNNRLTGYDAYRILQSKRDGAGSSAALAAFVGMAAGLALAGGGYALATSGQLPISVDDEKQQRWLWAGAAGLVVAGAALGGTIGYMHYQANWPQVVEVRNGTDRNLAVRDLEDVVDQANWIRLQAQHPFTPEQQQTAAQFLDQHGGLFAQGLSRRRLKPQDALQRLSEGKPILLPNPAEAGKYVEIPSLRHLQEYDTVHGAAVNPVTSEAEMRALRYLSQHGQFQVQGKPVSGYQALDRMLRDRLPLEAKLNGKTYTVHDLREVEQLSALKGEGVNTILGPEEFAAMRFFDPSFRLGDKSLDAFEALQSMRAGKSVTVDSQGRQARLDKTHDAQLLHSLEVSGKNTFLDNQQDYDLLQFWQAHGGYASGRAYEAVKTMEAGGEFGVLSADRSAPARSYRDLQDLAAFEAPGNPFPDTVPKEARDRLEYFQGTGRLAFRVGARQGRAYEGYRELRDGHRFEVAAGGDWNTVESLQDLHELDAMLGRRVNDILPKAQYDLLHHLGDESKPEGLVGIGGRLNSYQALQAFQKNQTVGYEFVGGDFAETLHVPVQDLEHLAEARLRRDNQKEYDRFRYPVDEFREKMQRQQESLPELARDDMNQSQQHLRAGQDDESRGRSHKSRGESDLSSATSDRGWAQARLIVAYAMPSENAVTKYRTVYDSDGNSHQESYTDYEHNFARDAAIWSAQSDISSAENRMSRARSDISDAEREIRQAQEEIARAQREIGESQELQQLAAQLGAQLGTLNEANSAAVIAQLRSEVARMRQLSHTGSLNGNLVREGKLIENMNRPARPDGWRVPTPRAQP